MEQGSEVKTALNTLWNLGLSPACYATLDKAAEGAAELVRALRGHLDNPPPDVQEKVLAMQGECRWHQNSGGNWRTDCGRLWATVEGSPSENGMEWCPMCRGKLVEEGCDDD